MKITSIVLSIFAFAIFGVSHISAMKVKNAEGPILRPLEERTKLEKAVLNDDIEAVKGQLAQNPQDVNRKNDAEKTPLQVAIRRVNFSFKDVQKGIITMLIQSPQIDVNSKDDGNYTALMYAVEKGLKEVVELLLKKPGIDVSVASNQGSTALMLAENTLSQVESKDIEEIVEMLKNYK